MSYWDTSVLLKLYLSEPDSAYFLDLARTLAEPIYTSEVAKVEVLCALYRKEHSGALKLEASEALFERFLSHVDMGHVIIVPYGTDVLAEIRCLAKRLYRHAPPIMLRSLDAIHLASAVVCKADTLIGTDARLREAAAFIGLTVAPK